MHHMHAPATTCSCAPMNIYCVTAKCGLMAYINEAPMRIGTEDPWALTELAKAGGPGGRGPPCLCAWALRLYMPHLAVTQYMLA